METDYISRADAVRALMERYHYDQSSVAALYSVPAADVRPVKRGEWTDKRTIEHDGEWYCTACGKEITIYMGADRKDRYAFCPNCGADMRTIGQRLSDISAEEDLFPELIAEEKAENKAEAKRMIGGANG